MQKRQSLLIVSFSKLKSDPRVKRQIKYLSTHYDVTAIGWSDPEIEGVEYIDASFQLNKWYYLFTSLFVFLGFNELYYHLQQMIRVANKVKPKQTFDLILANDIDSVPFVLSLKSSTTKILFDAHEYAPKEHDDSLLWRMLFKRYKTFLIRKYASKADGMLTVCDGIASEYKKNFNLNPLVITNAADFRDFEIPNKTSSKIRLIHHGLALPTRKIENMIYMMDEVDERFELDLMLVESKSKYYEFLKELVSQRTNVKLIPSVPTDEIMAFCLNYDIGVYLLEPTNFNNANALPNKFFEFIQSRLAVLIGPSPEMAKIVQHYSLGWVVPDFHPQSFSKILNALTSEEIQQYRLNSAKASVKVNSEENMKMLQEEIVRLLNDSQS